MKKIYMFIMALTALMFYSQPYSSLLKNTDWTIMKIQWFGTTYYPPVPFVTSGKVKFNFDDNSGFRSTFFNSATGNVIFGENNASYFTVQNIGVSLADYFGVNAAAVQEFDSMATGFYFGYQPPDHFDFEYQENFSGRNLTVTNPLGYKIFYSNLILASSEKFLNKEIAIYPNPAKEEFFIQSALPISEKVNVEIYDRSGKLISCHQIFSNDAIEIKSLLTGTYWVKITNSKLNYSTQLIVKK